MDFLLKEGLEIMDNVEEPQNESHKQLTYCDQGHAKLHEVGVLVFALHPTLSGMITFAQTNIPEKYHGIINHSWDGIGEWVA